MVRKINRKGLSSIGELAGGLIILTFAVVIFLLLIAIFGEGEVHSTIAAENAAFTCQNNIVKFMDFEVPGNNKTTYYDLLVRAYAEENYTDFVNKATVLFNSFMINKWRFKVRDSVSTTPLIDFGHGIKGDTAEICTYELAIPCRDYSVCSATAVLTLDYEERNSEYIGDGE